MTLHTAADLAAAAGIAAALTRIARSDAARFTIPLAALAVLVAAGLLWQLAGSGRELVAASWWPPVIGAVLGFGIVAVSITAAELLSRRWPLMPGDALLLAAIGWVLGPLGLAWALLIGAPAAALHRACLQRKRHRRLSAGYAPLGPGMAIGAFAVFAAMTAAQALAQEDDGIEDVEASPVALAAIDAVELAPEVDPGPPGAAELIVTLDQGEPVAWIDLAPRLADAAGFEVRVEERPSRIEDGAAALPDPAPVSLSYEGPLAALLDILAAETGYRWTWKASAIVFYRYWDVAWLADPAAGREEGQVWPVRLARHDTLRALVEGWARDAGWQVAWRASRDYRLGADAEFSGSFLAAVDQLLLDPATRRSLTAVAHSGNRTLVIGDAQ